MQSIAEMEAAAAALAENIKLAKDEARRLELKTRRAKEKAVADEHYERMFVETGQPFAGLSRAQHAIVYSQARQLSNGSGYDDIEHYYGELAEMVRQLNAI